MNTPELEQAAPRAAERPSDAARAQQKAARSPGPGRFGMMLVLLGLFACVLRLPGLNRPIVGDEQTTVTLAGEPVARLLRDLVAYDAHPPLYPLIMIGWASVSHTFGAPAAIGWLRALSLICVDGSILLMVALVRRVFGEAIAWSAGIFAACSPLLVFLSQYARPYALGILIGTVAVTCAVRWLESAPGKGKAWLAGVAISLAALLYTFYLSIFIVAGIGLAGLAAAWLTRRSEVGWWVLAVVVGSIAWLPWLPAYGEQMRSVAAGSSSSTPLLKSAGMGAYVGGVQVGALAKPVLALWQMDDPRVLTTRLSVHLRDWRLIALGLAGLAATALAFWAGALALARRERVRGAAVLAVTLTVLPILGAAVFSLCGDLGLRAPVAVNVRYFGDSALWMTVIAAAALSVIRNRWVARGLLILAIGGMLAQLPRLYRYPFQDQRAMLGLLSQTGVTAVASLPETSATLLDGAGRAQFQSRYREWVLTSGQTAGIADEAAQHEQIALIERTTAERIAGGNGLVRSFEGQLERRGFQKVEEKRISDMLMIRIYRRAAS